MSRTRKLVLALVALVVVQLPFATPASAAGGNRYYVAVGGSDASPGTLRAPFRTIRHALTTLRAGDTLYVRGGVYTEHVGGPGQGFVALSPGNANGRVTVTAYRGERPVIQGLVWIDGMDYWTFDGINVTWDSTRNTPDDHMVRLRNGIGWRWQDSEIWGARSYANMNILSSVAGEPANWIVRRNCIHDNYGAVGHGDTRDQLLYVNTGLNGGTGTIARNILFNAPRGKAIKLAGPDPGTGSNNVVVRYNTVHNSNKPGIVVAWATRNTSIYRNLVVGTDDIGLIRGYQLEGDGNVAYDNAGFAGPRLLVSDAGYRSITDGGGNVFPVDPMFDGTGSCTAYRPTSRSAQAYGRWAVGNGGN